MDARAKLHPTDKTLNSYGLGKLDDASAEALNEHLESCPDCRRRVAELSADSFLGRLRDARARDLPDPLAHPISSIAGLSMPANRAPSLLAPPPASGLPPGLADHSDYRVVRELGQGGMGVVYLAENILMGRKEVLKVVGSHLINRSGVLDRFLAEIRNAARLHHPNVVTAYAVVRLGDSFVLAMEYVDGLDLARLVKARGPLPVANACNYLHQATLGLQHAHESGMVHRDIKPGNLMLSRQGNQAVVKVLDFGLAKVIREAPTDGALTQEGQMLGTPDFIAPEQIADARRADIRADIYSLGCTLYYLLTARPPFQGTSLYDILQAHHSMEATPLNLASPEVPIELAAVVGKMMAKNPERRFQTPKEVAQALKPFFKKGHALSPGSGPLVSQMGERESKQARPKGDPSRTSLRRIRPLSPGPRRRLGRFYMSRRRRVPLFSRRTRTVLVPRPWRVTHANVGRGDFGLRSPLRPGSAQCFWESSFISSSRTITSSLTSRAVMRRAKPPLPFNARRAVPLYARRPEFPTARTEHPRGNPLYNPPLPERLGSSHFSMGATSQVGRRIRARKGAGRSKVVSSSGLEQKRAISIRNVGITGTFISALRHASTQTATRPSSFVRHTVQICPIKARRGLKATRYQSAVHTVYVRAVFCQHRGTSSGEAPTPACPPTSGLHWT